MFLTTLLSVIFSLFSSSFFLLVYRCEHPTSHDEPLGRHAMLPSHTRHTHSSRRCCFIGEGQGQEQEQKQGVGQRRRHYPSHLLPVVPSVCSEEQYWPKGCITQRFHHHHPSFPRLCLHRPGSYKYLAFFLLSHHHHRIFLTLTNVHWYVII